MSLGNRENRTMQLLGFFPIHCCTAHQDQPTDQVFRPTEYPDVIHLRNSQHASRLRTSTTAGQQMAHHNDGRGVASTTEPASDFFVLQAFISLWQQPVLSKLWVLTALRRPHPFPAALILLRHPVKRPVVSSPNVSRCVLLLCCSDVQILMFAPLRCLGRQYCPRGRLASFYKGTLHESVKTHGTTTQHLHSLRLPPLSDYIDRKYIQTCYAAALRRFLQLLTKRNRRVCRHRCVPVPWRFRNRTISSCTMLRDSTVP